MFIYIQFLIYESYFTTYMYFSLFMHYRCTFTNLITSIGSSLTTDKNKDSPFKFEDKDKLSMNTLLSRIDGIGNYNGVIIIATTNNKDNLSPALYRDGRLDLVEFTYSRRCDIVNIIEKFYGNKLTDEEISILPDRKDGIAACSVKRYLEENEDDYKNVLKILSSMIKEKV